MSRLKRSVLHLARFTLEAKSALSIGTGGSDGVYDHPIVRDANGLPMIPGTSLAGVLRHLWIANHGGRETTANALFGYQRYDKGDASRLEVAACALQNSQGQPVAGLLLGSARKQLETDALLRAALATREDPVFRDRVRLTHRGVAKKNGKFDRSLLLAGYRFSGELRLWSERPDDPDWPKLLALLADPRLRLGGATRAGLGALALHELHTGSFDLNGKSEDIARFRAVSAQLGDRSGLQAQQPPTSKAPVRQLRLHLKAKDFWRIGQGNQALGQYDKTPDLLPKTEPMVRWNQQGHGTIEPRLALLPASSIKGALAHRTAFYWNVLSGQFVDDMAPKEVEDWEASEHCQAVQQLFGYAKDREIADGRTRDATGRAGRILIDDVYLPITEPKTEPNPQQRGILMHNSIDRFTGGVRNRMLFSEELLYQQSIELTISLLPGVEDTDPKARRALARAVNDLCEGRLALGAGATKGHGAFTGQPVDDNTRAWLQAQEENH